MCRNNAGRGLERHPMRSLYDYDIAADLLLACQSAPVTTPGVTGALCLSSMALSAVANSGNAGQLRAS
jgi:hypothetical protein